MEYRSVADIYEANDRIHLKLRAALAELTDEQAAVLPEGEKWTVAQIVEHISLVEGGICRICAKLLSKAEASGQMNTGSLDLADFFKRADGIADVKLEAPEMVHPVHGRTIAESLALMDENTNALRDLRDRFERYDGGAHAFPHPYLGDLSALEWLTLAGGHKIRHLKQIKRVIEKSRTGI